MDNNQKTFANMKKTYQNRKMPKEEYLHMLVKMKEAERRNQIDARKKCAKVMFPVAACLAVVLLVLPNTSKDIAYAMSKVPVLNRIVEVAVVRDYEYEDVNAKADVKVPSLSYSTATEDESLVLDGADKEQVPIDQQEIQMEFEESFSNMNSQVSKIADKLVAEFKAGIKNKDGFRDVVVSYRIMDTTENYFTLRLICRQIGASAAEWDYYYTINLKNGKLVTLDSLFTDIPGYKEIIVKEIKNQMKSIMEEDESAMFWEMDEECLDEEIDLLTENTQFYINKDGELVICYDEGDVAPMSMGVVNFVIPNEIIRPTLN